MKRLLSVLLLFVFVFVVAGCGGSGSVAGKYYHDSEEGTYIELKKDGSVWLAMSYYEHEIEAIEIGTYKTSGNNITVQFGDNPLTDPMTLKGTIKGKTLSLHLENDKDSVEVFHKK